MGGGKIDARAIAGYSPNGVLSIPDVDATFSPVTTRRSFLSTMGAALVGAACSRTGSTVPSSRLDRIGVQLYTVRDALARDFDGTLAHIAELGYRELEFAGYHGKSPADVRATITRLGMTAPASHVSLAEFRKDAERAIANATQVGHRYLVVPWLDASERKTLDDYRRLADELNTLGERVRNASMILGYHNHDFELEPIEGRVPLDVMLERADPSLVVLELDLYWATKAGADPLTYFSRYPGRVHLVHVKDSAGAPDHRMVNVGQGTIDFARLLSRREQAGIRHAFVEHDNPANALETLRVSHDHLAQLRW